MLCANCGNEVKEGSKFCAFCGTPVTAPVEEQPVVTAPAEEQPVVTAPAEEQPVVAAPVEEQPVVTAPVEEQPVAAAPVEEQPVVTAPTEEQPVAAPVQGMQQSGIPMPGVPMPSMQQPGTMPGAQQPGTPMQGWQQPGTPVPGAQQPGTPMQGWQQPGTMPGAQQSGTSTPGMQPGAPTQGWQPAVPPPVQNKKKGKAGLIVAIVILLLVVAGGGVGAFLVLNNSPVKKIEKAFASDDIYTAIELYEKVKSEKDIEKVKAIARDYAEQIKDKYLHEEIDYDDAASVLDELGYSILRRDDALEEMTFLIDSIQFSRESYEDAESYRESGDYLLALLYYDCVIKEDTAYYDLAQQAIEEVKDLYREDVLNEARDYMNDGYYELAKSVLEDALFELGEDAEISRELENVESAIEEAAIAASRELEKIAGIWGMEVDMGPYLASELGEGFEDFDGSFLLNILVEFTKEGTYRMYVDADVFRENLDQWLDDFIDYSVEMMYEVFEEQGISRSEADELMRNTFDSTMEEYLRETMSYYLDYEYLLENMENSGTYTLDGNKICWDGYSYNYDIFSITGNILTIEEPAGSDGEEIFPGVGYPLVFSRVQ